MSVILPQLKLGNATAIQALQNGQNTVVRKSTSGVNPASAPMRGRGQRGVGKGQDCDCSRARPATVRLGGFGYQCQRGLLVRDLQGRGEGRVVYREAQAPEASLQEAFVSGS